MPRTITAPRTARTAAPTTSAKVDRAIERLESAILAHRGRTSRPVAVVPPEPTPLPEVAGPAPIMGDCDRCSGMGTLGHYRHVESGRCFACDGSGKRAYRAGLPTTITPPPAPTTFDLTRDNGRIAVAHPATGNVRVFRVETVASGNLAGQRIISVFTGEDPDRSTPFEWRGFGFVDGFGIHVWRTQDHPDHHKYVSILTETAKYAGRLEYAYQPA